MDRGAGVAVLAAVVGAASCALAAALLYSSRVLAPLLGGWADVVIVALGVAAALLLASPAALILPGMRRLRSVDDWRR
jgi:hypothetical protein